MLSSAMQLRQLLQLDPLNFEQWQVKDEQWWHEREQWQVKDEHEQGQWQDEQWWHEPEQWSWTADEWEAWCGRIA